MSIADAQINDILAKKDNVLTIINKSDLKRKMKKFENEIEISALKDENVEKIKEKIYFSVLKEEIMFDKAILLNARQNQILLEASQIIKEIYLNKNVSMDIIAMLIKNFWNTLGKITGECENENIIDLIFSKFCLGK